MPQLQLRFLHLCLITIVFCLPTTEGKRKVTFLAVLIPGGLDPSYANWFYGIAIILSIFSVLVCCIGLCKQCCGDKKSRTSTSVNDDAVDVEGAQLIGIRNEEGQVIAVGLRLPNGECIFKEVQRVQDEPDELGFTQRMYILQMLYC